MINQTNAGLPVSNSTKEIDLRVHFNIIKKKFWIIVLLTILTTSIGYIKNTYFSTPLYQSNTRMIINADTKLLPTLFVLIRDTTILEKVSDSIGGIRSPEGLVQQISVGSVNDSQVVFINVVDTDPTIAAEIANNTANVFKNEIGNIVSFDSNNIKLLTEAIINPYPINSNPNRTIIIAFMMGGILGIGMIYLLDSLDNSVRSKEEIESILGSPVLGTISKMNKKSLKNNEKKQRNLEVRGEIIGYYTKVDTKSNG
jgi:capsular polysaccharide biosynthesis protein